MKESDIFLMEGDKVEGLITYDAKIEADKYQNLVNDALKIEKDKYKRLLDYAVKAEGDKYKKLLNDFVVSLTYMPKADDRQEKDACSTITFLFALAKAQGIPTDYLTK